MRRWGTLLLTTALSTGLTIGLVASTASVVRAGPGTPEFPWSMSGSLSSEACDLADERRSGGTLRGLDSEPLDLDAADEHLTADTRMVVGSRRDGRWGAALTIAADQTAEVVEAGCDVSFSYDGRVEARRSFRGPGWVQVNVSGRGPLESSVEVTSDGQVVGTVVPGDGTRRFAVPAGEATAALLGTLTSEVPADAEPGRHSTSGTAYVEVLLVEKGGSPTKQDVVSGGPYLHLPDTLRCGDEPRLRVSVPKRMREKLKRAVLRVDDRRVIGHRRDKTISLAVAPALDVDASLFVKLRNGKRATIERSYLPCS